MSYWNNKNYMEFISYVKGEYKENEEDIVRMIDSEIDRLESFWKGKKRLTVKVKREIIDAALANCRAWLSEPAKETIDPHYLANNAIAKIYFNMLKNDKNEKI